LLTIIKYEPYARNKADERMLEEAATAYIGREIINTTAFQ
jgi:hypothetical protein